MVHALLLSLIFIYYELESHPSFQFYKGRLARGWLFGRQWMDASDHQFKVFRQNIPVLASVMFVFAILSRFIRYISHWWVSRNVGGGRLSNRVFLPPSDSFLAERRYDTDYWMSTPRRYSSRLGESENIANGIAFRNRRFFIFIFGTGFLVALHGANFLYIQAAFVLNFGIARLSRSKKYHAWIPLLTWTFAVGSLYCTCFLEFHDISQIFSFLSFLV